MSPQQSIQKRHVKLEITPSRMLRFTGRLDIALICLLSKVSSS